MTSKKPSNAITDEDRELRQSDPEAFREILRGRWAASKKRKPAAKRKAKK